jgi:hypothetical protein
MSLHLECGPVPAQLAQHAGGSVGQISYFRVQITSGVATLIHEV